MQQNGAFFCGSLPRNVHYERSLSLGRIKMAKKLESRVEMDLLEKKPEADILARDVIFFFYLRKLLLLILFFSRTYFVLFHFASVIKI